MTLNIAKNVDSDAKSDLKEILGNWIFFRLIAGLKKMSKLECFELLKKFKTNIKYIFNI